MPGQVGIASTSLTGVSAIAGGISHSLALKSDGTVWAWGYNNRGQLGNNSTTATLRTPVQVLTEDPGTPGTYIPSTNVQEVDAGNDHSLARKGPAASRTVWGWGANSVGQLGNNGATTMFDTAEQVVTEDTANPGTRKRRRWTHPPSPSLANRNIRHPPLPSNNRATTTAPPSPSPKFAK